MTLDRVFEDTGGARRSDSGLVVARESALQGIRALSPGQEIGELVLFICSDACEFMTADTIYVNGGGGWR